MKNSVFDDITLSWGDENYTVPADRVMGLLARIDSHITFSELNNPNGVPVAKLSNAYSAALAYAGANVPPEKIYYEFFNSGSDATTTAIAGLMTMMIPPGHLQSKNDKDQDK